MLDRDDSFNSAWKSHVKVHNFNFFTFFFVSSHFKTFILTCKETNFSNDSLLFCLLVFHLIFFFFYLKMSNRVHSLKYCGLVTMRILKNIQNCQSITIHTALFPQAEDWKVIGLTNWLTSQVVLLHVCDYTEHWCSPHVQFAGRGPVTQECFVCNLYASKLLFFVGGVLRNAKRIIRFQR